MSDEIRAIVEEVAAETYRTDDIGEFYCPYCRGLEFEVGVLPIRVNHSKNCLRVRAQTALARHAPSDAVTASTTYHVRIELTPTEKTILESKIDQIAGLTPAGHNDPIYTAVENAERSVIDLFGRLGAALDRATTGHAPSGVDARVIAAAREWAKAERAMNGVECVSESLDNPDISLEERERRQDVYHAHEKAWCALHDAIDALDAAETKPKGSATSGDK